MWNFTIIYNFDRYCQIILFRGCTANSHYVRDHRFSLVIKFILYEKKRIFFPHSYGLNIYVPLYLHLEILTPKDNGIRMMGPWEVLRLREWSSHV